MAGFGGRAALSLQEIVTLLATRDPADMGPVSLEMTRKEGSARGVAEMMVERNAVFPALLELVCHTNWSVHLGAMVAIEALAALSPALGREALKRLWGLFEAESNPVRGNILFLSGEVGELWLPPTISSVMQRSAAADIR